MTIPEKARLFHACQTVYTPHKRADSYLLCQYLQQLVKWDTPVRNVPTQAVLFFRIIWKLTDNHSASSWPKSRNMLHFLFQSGIRCMTHKSYYHFVFSFHFSLPKEKANHASQMKNMIGFSNFV